MGGTKIEGVLLDQNRTVTRRHRMATPVTYQDTIQAIVRAVHTVRPASPYTVGIGIPGQARHDGTIQNSNLECIRDMPLERDVSVALDMPIHMGNDADCFVLSECTLGAAREFNVVFGVVMGTGVGAGIAIHGTPLVGRRGCAGEWGHCTLYPDGNRCWCGRRGCVETYISGPALRRRWLQKSGTDMDIPHIVSAQPPGFEEWRDDIIHDFALALSNVVQVLDPDIIVMGGGLSNMDFLYDMGAETLHDMIPYCDTPIVPNSTGDSGGSIGAALLGATAAQ